MVKLTMCAAVLSASGARSFAQERLRLVTVSNPRTGVAVIVDVPGGAVTPMRFPRQLPAPALLRHDHLVLGPMIAAHLSLDGRVTGARAELGTVIVSPGGRHLLETREERWFLTRLDATEASVPLGPGGVPVWSPDGSRIAWSSPEGLGMHRPGGATTTLPGVTGQPLAWSPDNARLLLSHGKHFELFGPASDQREELDFSGTDVHRFVSWSADGGRLYLLAGSNGTFRPNHSPEFYPPALPALPLARIAVYDIERKTLRCLTGDTRDLGIVECVALPALGKLAAWEFRIERGWDKGPGGIPVRRVTSFGRLLLIDPADGTEQVLVDLARFPEALPEYRPGVLSVLESRSALRN